MRNRVEDKLTRCAEEDDEAREQYFSTPEKNQFEKVLSKLEKIRDRYGQTTGAMQSRGNDERPS